MSFCPNCGSQLPESCAFCPNCGNQVQSFANQQPSVQQAVQSAAQPAAPQPFAPQPAQPMGGQYPQAPAYQQQTSFAPAPVNDSGSFGWAVLGFLIPIVGLILYLVWKDKKPACASKAIAGAAAGFIFNLVVIVFGG